MVELALRRTGRCGERGLEPRVLVAAVIGHEVQQHPQSAGPRLGDESVDIGEGAEDRVHGAVVGDVIAGVGLRGEEERGEPHRVDPELAEVVQSGGDARQVAQTIAVGVGERPRVDLVDDGVAPPVGVGAHMVSGGWACGAIGYRPGRGSG